MEGRWLTRKRQRLLVFSSLICLAVICCLSIGPARHEPNGQLGENNAVQPRPEVVSIPATRPLEAALAPARHEPNGQFGENNADQQRPEVVSIPATRPLDAALAATTPQPKRENNKAPADPIVFVRDLPQIKQVAKNVPQINRVAYSKNSAYPPGRSVSPQYTPSLRPPRKGPTYAAPFYSHTRNPLKRGYAHKVTILGTQFTMALMTLSHVGLINDHLSREVAGYTILRDSIRQAGENPRVVDVGGNHGSYALYAAMLGAEVWCVEPQRRLCDLIEAAALANGVQGKIKVVCKAVMGTVAEVGMRGHHINEGAIGTVVKGMKGGIRTAPVTDIVPSDGHPIAFLKVDVEGHEVEALRSAGALWHLVQNVLVEFGPPGRWLDAANMEESQGVQIQADLVKAGFEEYLLPSFVYSHNRWSGANHRKGPHDAIRIKRGQYSEVVDDMRRCNCEGYLWWRRAS